MKRYSPYEYLLIDIANQYGLDKETFEDRILWGFKNAKRLEELGEEKGNWKEKPLYVKGVQALRKVQLGIPTGHMIGLDSTCSGLQIMSVVTGCHVGALHTNLVDPDDRKDAYSIGLDLMLEVLAEDSLTQSPERKALKQAVMTALYGSKAEPKKLFGEDTPELEAFYKALENLGPGACQLLEDLRNSWQPYALSHSWTLPDNHHVDVRCMKKEDYTIRIDELGGSFNFRFKDVAPEKYGLTNIANVVHSIDAYILRSLVRRCDYDPEDLYNFRKLSKSENISNTASGSQNIKRMIEVFKSTGVVDVSIFKYINESNYHLLSAKHVRLLTKLAEDMLTHPPFSIITIHDDFKCHANNVEQMRFHYKEILADLADSTILDHIFTCLYGKPIRFKKLSHNLGRTIREQANYAIC